MKKFILDEIDHQILDILIEKDSLSNIEKKVNAKKKLVSHLTTKKEIKESKDSTLILNENLLNAVLTNNFNVLYSNTPKQPPKLIAVVVFPTPPF